MMLSGLVGCLLIAPIIVAVVEMDCSIKQSKESHKKSKVKNCGGQAVEVDVTVSSCEKGGDMISATLSDADQKVIFSHFSGICGKTTYKLMCTTGSILDQHRGGCHIKTHYFDVMHTIINDEWVEKRIDRHAETTGLPGHFGYFDKTYYKAYRDKHFWMAVEEEDHTDENPPYIIDHYYDVPLKRGYIFPVYETELLKKKKTIICIPRHLEFFDMKLNHHSENALDLKFQPLKMIHAISTNSTKLRLKTSTDYEWAEGADWTLSVLKVISLASRDTHDPTYFQINLKTEFLVISLDQNDRQNGTGLKTVVLTKYCDSVRNFDGASKEQDKFMYKTFTSTVRLILSSRSTPALDYGDWFLAIYTQENVLLNEESFTLQLRAVPYRQSVGSMFLAPLLSGVAIIVCYHLSIF